MASAQQQIEIDGVPDLQVDTLHSGAAAAASLVIAHANLLPGMYTVIEHSAAPVKGADPGTMADLVAIFVFGKVPAAHAP
jgi:hypothetical protein